MSLNSLYRTRVSTKKKWPQKKLRMCVRLNEPGLALFLEIKMHGIPKCVCACVFCVYACMFWCDHVYVYVYVYVYGWIYIYGATYDIFHTDCQQTSACICMHEFIYTHVRICIYIYIYIYIYIHSHLFEFTISDLFIQTLIKRLRVYVCMNICIHIDICVYIYTYRYR